MLISPDCYSSYSVTIRLEYDIKNHGMNLTSDVIYSDFQYILIVTASISKLVFLGVIDPSEDTPYKLKHTTQASMSRNLS